jgi:hypothetical protein
MSTDKEREKPTDNQGISRSDLAQDEMGNNQLQGDDQENVRNQRHAVPDVKTEADGVIESFEKFDTDERAKTDLGKGNMRSED